MNKWQMKDACSRLIAVQMEMRLTIDSLEKLGTPRAFVYATELNFCCNTIEAWGKSLIQEYEKAKR